VLGIAGAALLEGASRTFRTPREIETALSIPVLGFLPLVAESEFRLAHERRRPFRGGRADRLKRFGVDRQLTPFGEALRAIRTRLMGDLAAPTPGGGRVLLVASALADEGKSTIASNLAHSLARAGLSTLLIDADVRRPALVQKGASPAGLLQALRGVGELPEMLTVEKDSGLRVLPVGTVESIAEASDLVGSKAMPELLERLRGEFDLVILDAPPILPFADGRQLANWANLVLMVVAWGTTDRDSASAALEELGANVDKVAGIVLNKVDLRAYPLYATGYAYQDRPARAAA
jgi:succinoglycan biosynthesis transport protein ExoP